ncbi:MAG: ABC1 kinase family protein [Pyrinomonadaceae bacterium]
MTNTESVPSVVAGGFHHNGSLILTNDHIKPDAASLDKNQNPKRPEHISAEQIGEKIRLAAQRSRGIRGIWRGLQIVHVLGQMALYLHLENYDVQADFNRKMIERKRELSKLNAGHTKTRFWILYLGLKIYDLTIRTLRVIVFRGNPDSAKKVVRQERQAVWLKERLIALGPTFIKVGQALGTRADLLPLPYVKELITLLDQVPPFSNAEAFSLITTELAKSGSTVSDLFVEIDPEPVAAASLGQVYRAKLKTGQEVAVKVQRPNLESRITFDIAVLRRIVALLKRIRAFNENADWEGMLAEFTQTIFEEMDYRQEALNAERFRHNFRDWRAIHVPVIYHEYSTSRILTMEFIHGTKVVDLEGLKSRRISSVKVNRLLVKAYLKQLLEDGFFHADPHPGNLLVMFDGRLAVFDFGMTGRINAELQSKMINAFFHVVERDVQGLAEDLIKLDFLKPGIDPEKVRPVVEGLFGHYINLKLGDVNFKELTYDLAEVIYEYPFRLPMKFTYIIRALMTLEGIGIVTDPGFSFFDTAKPYAKEFTLRREGKRFRQMVFDKLTGREQDSQIEWHKMWKLTKMAVQIYVMKK